MLSSIPGIENLPPAVKYLIAFAIIFMLLALFALVLRRLTGGRLTLANDRGRARQPRLGIVDVYDLDRHRQLILLRRDNVEHLLLVGGPNDVVVETNIVRVPGARLPAVPADGTERADAVLPERPPEIAPPARPVVEAPLARPAAARSPEPVVAGHLGRAETAAASAPTPLRPIVGRGEASSRPAGSAGPAGNPQRGGDRSRATPIVTAPQPVVPASSEAQPAPAAKEGVGARGFVPDMARKLEEVLKRPEPAPSGPRRPEPAAEAQRPRPAPPAPEPVASPAQPVPVAAAPEHPTIVPPSEPGPADKPAPAPANNPPAEPAKQPDPPPPPPLRPAPAPAIAAASPPASKPEVSRPAAEAAPAEGPAAPTPRPDPFSIEDIEAEFARLLGRPLDRKDNKS